jgi:hypothetical protein
LGPPSPRRRRERPIFTDVEKALSRREFTRAFRKTQDTFLALLRLLECDLARDIRMALRSRGGKIEPAVRLALAIRMLAGTN